MAQKAHPPTPGPFVQPNFLAVMEAVGDVAFPISKRELIEQVGDDTVLFQGRNVALHDLIKDIHDDYFDSEDELLAAMETEYARPDEAEADGGVLPAGPQEPWRSRADLGEAASAESDVEPRE